MQTTLVSCEEDLTLCLVFGLEIVTTTMSSGPRVFCNAAFHHITAHLLLCLYHSVVLQGGPKKSGISKTMAITPLKSNRKGKSWCVSENSA